MISLAPHAAIEFKRVFPRADKAEIGTLHLSDSPETARRLLWFSQLCPLEFDPPGHAEARAAEYQAQATLVDRILAADFKAEPVEMAMTPRPYQAQAAALVLASGALLLGDDLGTGKSMSAFTMLADPRSRPAVYVTLTALPGQVQEMLSRALPGLRSHVIKSATPYDLTRKPYTRTGKTIPFPDVIITSWSKLAGWAETLAALGTIKSLILDECHELRHRGTDRYNAAKHLAQAAHYKLGLTGTPIMGMGSQMFNLIDVIKPGALGTWEEFCRERCGGERGEKPPVEDPDALGLYLRQQGLMLRRTRAEVKRWIPEIQRIRVPVESDGAALHDVNSRAIELAVAVLQAGGRGEEKMRASGELDWRLRQATGVGKARAVADFVQMQLEAGERVLLGGWHHAVYALWKEYLADWRPAFFTGEESTAEKMEAKARFCDPKHPDPTQLLIMSVRSGAGLDGLQYSGCSVVVFGELDWAPAMMEQFEGRIHRDGQPNPVLAYYLVSETGSDPIISDVLGLKQAQLTGIRDPGTAKTMKVPDQEAIRTRMKRLAAAYLAKHDPRALAKIPGAAELLTMPEEPLAPAPQTAAPPVVEQPAAAPVQLVQAPSLPGRPYTVDVVRPAAQELAPAVPAPAAPTTLPEAPATPPPVVPKPAPRPALPVPRRMGVRLTVGV